MIYPDAAAIKSFSSEYKGNRDELPEAVLKKIRSQIDQFAKAAIRELFPTPLDACKFRSD
jgi:hypothetical protein